MRTLLSIAIVLSFAACTADVEQVAHPSPRDARPATSAGLASQDRDFVERAAQGSNAEISMGKIVDEHSLRPEVLAFGRLMVTDHYAINEQLRAIAAKKHIELAKSLGDQQQNFDRVVDLEREHFDREYMRVMIESHQQAVELFRNEAKNGIDPELKAFAASTLPRIEAHFDHALSMKEIAAFPQELTAPPSSEAVEPPSIPRNPQHQPASPRKP
jgi:putative membrane protein